MSIVQAPGPPSRLGRFEVGAKIGGGGMATVYIGRAPKANGEEELVALKVIRDELANDPRFAAMFIDEAKILSRLAHPNVIHTLEYGITGPNRFIAMELLSGRTYADVWDLLAERGEAMPVRLGAWICARVAEGLHSAHELADETGSSLHVIHRDVNPGNVFLTLDGHVKLIDFGLAKARLRTHKTDGGIVKGKIPYLAPEQAQTGPIDRRVDVYALGTTLWETATMKRLFKRENDVLTLKAILDAEVPDVRTMIDGFPEALWTIIARALERDRENRFPTAAAMQEALDAYVGDTTGLPGELAALLSRLFPGQEQDYAEWTKAATSVRAPKMTMPPPAPVPTASSTLLEKPPNVRDSAPPAKGEGDSAPPAKGDGDGDDRKRDADADGDDDPGAKRGADEGEDETGAAPPRGAKVPTAAPEAARPKAKTRNVAPSADVGYLAHGADPGGPKRFWVSLAVIVALVVLVALVYGR